MAAFILFLAVLFASAGMVFYAAGDMAGHGTVWASELCSTARALCNSPELAAIAAAGCGVLWLIVKIASALRG